MNLKKFDDLNAIEQLLGLMTMLRDKDHGCAWDLEQSIRSLAPFTLEEVYEVVDAIENDDMVELEDELGDLLFQVVFYAQIAEEGGHFNFADIARAISNKLVRRHPHVFPDGNVQNFGQKQELDAGQVVVNWDAIKQEEREEKRKRGGKSNKDSIVSILDDVPRALPAIERARKLQKRAASVGFDWPTMEPVIAKLREEIAEFEIALKSGEKDKIGGELGDLLFTVINMARHAGVEPEISLRSTNLKFERRFKWIESTLLEQKKNLQATPLDELEALWVQAKQSGL